MSEALRPNWGATVNARAVESAALPEARSKEYACTAVEFVASTDFGMKANERETVETTSTEIVRRAVDVRPEDPVTLYIRV